MNTFDYFFSIKGKINRLTFFFLLLGGVFLLALAKTILETFYPSEYVYIPIMILALYVFYCIDIKRINDIGKFHTVLHIRYVIYIVLFISVTLGLNNEIMIYGGGVINILLGIFLLFVCLFFQGDPHPELRFKQDEKEITIHKHDLTSVKSSFVPNFETTALVFFHENAYELILTKEKYDERLHDINTSHEIYVVHRNMMD